MTTTPPDVRTRALAAAFCARWREISADPVPSTETVEKMVSVHSDALLTHLELLAERETASPITLDELSKWLKTRSLGAFMLAQGDIEDLVPKEIPA